MTLISYAQNYEDVMLWRALKDVVGGCYIDVGANDPQVYSVTKAFYDQGWRGVNIEPLQQYYQLLCEQRTEDINLAVGAGQNNGFLTYYEIPDTGLSTLEEAVAEQHKKAGWKVLVSSITVMSLSTVCEKHVKGPIHFLKVDVEGAEKQVLLGMDFTLYRPWIVVVESTAPMSQQENFIEWEYILLDNQYQFVYFDGLNRYYISSEKMNELQPAFLAPPNVFDDFKLYSEYNLSLELNEKEGQCQQLEEVLTDKETKYQLLEEALTEKDNQFQQLQILFDSITTSWSWRFAKPLRLSAGYARRIKTKLRGNSLRRLIKAVLIPIVQFIMVRPRLRALLKPMISMIPGLKARLKKMQYDASMSMNGVDNTNNLSSRAAHIHADLLQALAEEQDKKQRKS